MTYQPELPLHGGVRTRPSDSLLVERARDFLAGGPADATALVRSVCQLPGLKREVAERVAIELLAPHREFELRADGRWGLAEPGVPEREVGMRAPAPRVVPTFDEWRAARGAHLDPAAAEARPRGRTRRTPEALPAAPLPGDDDRLHELSYVVVDVETTGGSPHAGHRITEIAAVVVERGEVKDVYETLVNPQRPIPPQIMRLTGITMEMVRDQPCFDAVCTDVVDALAGHVFVAHNVAFDWRFVSAEVQRVSGTVLEGRRLCTVRLARKLLPQLRSRSLGHVADWYGADAFAQRYFEGRHGTARPWRHSAAGDAVATAHCLLRLLQDASDKGVHTWGELDRWLSGGTGGARRRRPGRPSALPRPVDKDTTA